MRLTFVSVCCFIVTVEAGFFQLRTSGREDFLLRKELAKMIQRNLLAESEPIRSEPMKMIY